VPTFICETTSQMNFRLTSAAVTPPPTCGRAIVMYGSDSLRKYTGPNHVRPLRASRNFGSAE